MPVPVPVGVMVAFHLPQDTRQRHVESGGLRGASWRAGVGFWSTFCSAGSISPPRFEPRRRERSALCTAGRGAPARPVEHTVVTLSLHVSLSLSLTESDCGVTGRSKVKA